MNQLLAAGSWALDVVFFLLLIVGTLVGVKRGFIKGVLKMAGTIFAVVVAVTFCVSFQQTLEKWFGTTTALNNAIRAPFGGWIMVALCFILLLLLVKVGAKLLGALGTKLVNKYEPFRIVNMVLGGILGAFKIFMIIILILAIFRLIPAPSLHDFISSSKVVGAIFNADWIDITNLLFNHH